MANTIRNLMIRLGVDVSGASIGSLAKLENSLGSTAKKTEDLDAKLKRHKEIVNQVSLVAVGVGTAMVAGFGVAVAATMKFDKAMSNVGAVSNASGKELDGLRKAALQAGKDTVFSATQAAEAESELAKVGISASDIMGGALTGSLSLAAAGQLDLKEAATLAGQSMKIFNLQGKDVGKVADVLAAGANKSAADVHQLGEALRAGGQVAANAGMNLQSTVGVLAAFADNALIGSDAGTSLKTMMIHLANPTQKSAALMDQLGISAYDTQGNFVGLSNLAGQLQSKMGNLTQAQRDQALAQIFGSDAMRGASILYKIGAKGVDEYTKAVDQQGAASTVAAKNLDNLSGDLEKLQGSIETALIQGGSSATGVLRGLTKAAGGLVDLFNGLPQPIQGTLTALTGVVGIVTAVSGAFVFGAPKVVAFRDALSEMGPRSQKFGKALSGVGSFLTGPWGLALAGAVAGLTFFAAKHQEAEARVQELTSAIEADSGVLGENTRAKVVNRLETDGLLKIAQKLGIGLDLVTNAALGNKDALAQVNAKLLATAGPVDAFHTKVVSLADGTTILSGDQQKLQTALTNVNGDLAESVRSYQRTESATGKASDSSKNFENKVAGVGTAAGKTASQMAQMNQKIERFNVDAGDATLASLDFKDKLDQMSEGIKRNHNGLTKHSGAFDTNTKKGRENLRMTIDAIRQASDYSEKLQKETGSVDKANAAFKRQIAQIRGVLEKMGLSRSEINKLINKYSDMATGINKATGRIHDKKVTLTAAYGSSLEKVRYNLNILLKKGMASGGIIPGYTPGKDNTVIAVGGGEAILRPEFTKALGEDFIHAGNRAARSGGITGVTKALGIAGDPGGVPKMQHFAGGGIVAGGKTQVSPQFWKTFTSADQLTSMYAKQLSKTFSIALTSILLGGKGGGAAVKAARKQLGVPYSWGGGGLNGPSRGFGRGANTVGFDCSSLVRYAWYQAAKKVMPRTTYTQWPFLKSFAGPKKPGDIGQPHPTHTFLYAGNNKIIEAPFTGSHVREVPARAARWKRVPNSWLKMDEGGTLPPHSMTPVYNGSNKPEYAIPQKYLEGGGTGTTNINITVNAPVGHDRRAMGKELLDVLAPYLSANPSAKVVFK